MTSQIDCFERLERHFERVIEKTKDQPSESPSCDIGYWAAIEFALTLTKTYKEHAAKSEAV